MRTFIAVELPPDIQQYLARLITLYQQAGIRDIRWTPVKNIHLTLRFLGDSSPVQLNAIKQALAGTIAAYPVFDIELGGNGVFPNLKRPRILWAGANIPDSLRQMQQQIETICREAGFKAEERAFSPHLTLGRFSEYASSDNVARLTKVWKENANSPAPSPSAHVTSITLFKSDLRPGGAVCSVLEHFPLKTVWDNKHFYAKIMNNWRDRFMPVEITANR